MDSKDVISKLKFIGEIKPDHKINVKNIKLQPNTYVTSFVRTFISSDNRTNTVEFLKNITHAIFQIVVLLKSENKTQEFENVISDMKKSIHGLNNLKNTYKDDVKFCCDIELLIQEIQTVLSKEEKRNNKKNI